jgi:hypothetical protein
MLKISAEILVFSIVTEITVCPKICSLHRMIHFFFVKVSVDEFHIYTVCLVFEISYK